MTGDKAASMRALLTADSRWIAESVDSKTEGALQSNADNLYANATMLRFNTLFLLKATAITALCCLPMALDKASGFVWTAFLLPISLAGLAAIEVEQHGQFEFKFKELPGSAVGIHADGGRQTQCFTRLRIMGAGGCLSLVIGFPMLHLVDPEPPEIWVPFIVMIALGGTMGVGYSARRRVLTEEREFVTDYFLFDRICWWRRRWQIRKGDYLAVFLSGQSKHEGSTDYLYWHALFVCRSRRRQMIASMYTGDRDVPDMEIAAHRVAGLVDLPYEGYREARILWWAS